jgi:hypothetical protein
LCTCGDVPSGEGTSGVNVKVKFVPRLM